MTLENDRQAYENKKLFEKGIENINVIVPKLVSDKLAPIDQKFLIVFS